MAARRRPEPGAGTRKKRSERQESLEEAAVAAQCDAQVLGGGVVLVEAVPELTAVSADQSLQFVEHVADEVVSAVNGVLRFLDEVALELGPPSLELPRPFLADERGGPSVRSPDTVGAARAATLAATVRVAIHQATVSGAAPGVPVGPPPGPPVSPVIDHPTVVAPLDGTPLSRPVVVPSIVTGTVVPVVVDRPSVVEVVVVDRPTVVTAVVMDAGPFDVMVQGGGLARPRLVRCAHARVSRSTSGVRRTPSLVSESRR